MTTAWRNVEMLLAGVDQYTDAPHVVAGKMRRAENVRFRDPPAVSKRYGHEQLTNAAVDANGNSTSISEGYQLIGHGKATLLATSKKLYAYDDSRSRWSERGNLSPCHISRTGVWSELKTYTDWDSAYNQGVVVFARPNAVGAINIVVLNATTGAFLNRQNLPLSVASGGTSPVRVIAAGNYIYIIDAEARYSRIDVTSTNYTFPATSTFVSVSNVSSAVALDACAFSSTEFVIAYKDSSTGGVFVHKISTSTNASTASLSNNAATPTRTLAVSATNGEGIIVVADSNAAALWYYSYTTSVTLNFAPVVVYTGSIRGWAGATRLNSTKRLVVVNLDDVSPALDNSIYMILDRTVSGVAAGPEELRDLRPAAKPFAVGGIGYCWVSYESIVNYVDDTSTLGAYITANTGGDQETLFLLQLTTSTPTILGCENSSADSPRVWTATAARGVAKSSSNTNFLPLTYLTSGTKWEFAAACKTKFSYAGVEDVDIFIDRWAVFRLESDFAPDYLHHYAFWGDGVMFAGGRPSWYDGVTCAELGFAWKPGNLRWKEVSLGEIPAGIHQLAACYERTDALGYVHRSAPSNQVEIDTSATDELQLELGETLLSDWLDSDYFSTSRCIPYRSVVDGSELHRAEVTPALGMAATDGTLPFGDDVNPATGLEGDVDIVKYDFLYTTGDILENTGLPPCKLAEKAMNRLWLGGLEETNVIWFSQPFVPGEGPRFNETLSLRAAFPVTALAGMDTLLVVFGTDDIQAVAGAGPPASGGLEGFQLIDVASDVGCIDPRSVVAYRDGVLFQSRKGLFHIDRGLNVKHLGLPAKGLFAAYPTIKTALALHNTSEVLWCVSNDSNGGNARIVWNYELNQWSLDTFDVLYNIASSAVVYKASTDEYVPALLSTTGRALRESSSTYADVIESNSTPIVMLIQTPYVKLNTLQDWIRVRGVAILAQFVGAHGLKVEVDYDYLDTWTEVHTFTQTEISALDEEELYIDFEQQVCKAVAIRITEVVETASAGPKFRSLVFEAGFEGQGRFRVPDAGRK